MGGPGRLAPGAWLRSPLGLTVGALALLVAGAAAGVLLGGWTVTDRPAGRSPDPRGAAPVSARLEALRREVEVTSAPTRKLLAFGHLALDEGQMPAAIWAYKRVLAREPDNAEAITHVGVILFRGGHVDEALARVEEALRIDPRYTHAHWDRAQMLLLGKQDYAGAERALEAFLALVPSGEDALRARAMLEEARRRAQDAAGRSAAGPRAVRDGGAAVTRP